MKKFYLAVCRAEATVAKLALLASTFLIFASSLARYINRPMNWSLEISMFIFAWCVFLSADVALRNDRMVNLDLLVKRLPRRAQDVMSVLVYALILAFLAVLIYYGFSLSWKTRVRSFHGVDFSYAWVTLSLPVAATLMSVTAFLKLRERCRRLLAPAGAKDGDMR